MSFGGKPMNVLSNKNTVLPAMAVMYIWKEAGYLMVFFLSGMQAISTELIEAAKIDGANSWLILQENNDSFASANFFYLFQRLLLLIVLN